MVSKKGDDTLVKLEYANHFMADLYMCQNKLWQDPTELMKQIRRLTDQSKINGLNWFFHGTDANTIRISGDWADSFILIHVFPEESFATIDIFSWKPKMDLKHFSESLVELFAPQVVAAESKLRAEHVQLN